MALVGAVRVAAYYNESLSQDLAKLLPFTLLGILLKDIGNFSFAFAWDTLSRLPEYWQTALVYLVFVIALEFFLRIIYILSTWARGEEIMFTSLGDTSIVKK